jgi:hypothetical protein
VTVWDSLKALIVTVCLLPFLVGFVGLIVCAVWATNGLVLVLFAALGLAALGVSLLDRWFP